MKTKPPAAAQRRTASVHSVTRASAAPGEVIDLVPQVLKLRSILVPVDFSPAAEKALRYAVAFARQFNARITLVHVRPVPTYPADLGYPMTLLPSAEPSERAVSRRLEADAARLIPEHALDRTLLRVGAPFDEICRTAAELKSDLIILSTHGYTGLTHVLMGSTAERVVRHAPCPVLIVREREQEFV